MGWLEAIFARLPMRYIHHLRRLSRDWRTSLTSPDSRFQRMVRELRWNLPVVAPSSGIPDADTGILTFQMLDVFSEEWSVHDFLLPEDYRDLSSMLPCKIAYEINHDGGLVCLLGVRSDDLFIAVPVLVVNPLTHDQKILPLQNLVYNEPKMLRLAVDRDSGQYKVILVGHRIDNGLVDAEVYESRTGIWSTMDFGDMLDFEFDYQEGGYHNTFGIYDMVSKNRIKFGNVLEQKRL